LDCDDILEQKQLKVSSFIPGIKCIELNLDSSFMNVDLFTASDDLDFLKHIFEAIFNTVEGDGWSKKWDNIKNGSIEISSKFTESWN